MSKSHSEACDRGERGHSEKTKERDLGLKRNEFGKNKGEFRNLPMSEEFLPKDVGISRETLTETDSLLCCHRDMYGYVSHLFHWSKGTALCQYI